MKYFWENDWENFKYTLPHSVPPMSKRNWGDKMHSLCSYQGKLKPSIANQLVKIFVPEKGSILDIFSGVGTIPLEAALQGKKSFAFDIGAPAVIISLAKLKKIDNNKINSVINSLEEFISKNTCTNIELEGASLFGFNGKVKEYFHPETLKEILIARRFFSNTTTSDPNKAYVLACLLHILHGNRPYALSRRSHGITPFAPKGDFEYKNLISKLKEKADRSFPTENRQNFVSGEVYFQDTTMHWTDKVHNLDAIITSPPFFASTRFYLANWMRMWFAGWNEYDFKNNSINFVEELQRKSFEVYGSIFEQSAERLKSSGAMVLHLGKNSKCDMAKQLGIMANKWFNVYDVFEEDVQKNESHGVTSKGSITIHQYMILTKKVS